MKKLPQAVYRYDFTKGHEAIYRYGFIWKGYIHYIDYPKGLFWPNYAKADYVNENDLLFLDWRKVQSQQDIHNINLALKNVLKGLIVIVK